MHFAMLLVSVLLVAEYHYMKLNYGGHGGNNSSQAAIIAQTAIGNSCDGSSQQSSPRHRRLEFVHIPKNGGSSIEKIAAENGIRWGLCHWKVKSVISSFPCPVDKNYTYIDYQQEAPGFFPATLGNKVGYHYPPWILQGLPNELNPYLHADLFAIVRNPYDRLVSIVQFRFRTRQLGVSALNDNLQALLQPRIQFVNVTFPFYMKDYVGDDYGHLIPQHFFVYQGREKYVDRVLRFENLTLEFDSLVSEYGLTTDGGEGSRSSMHLGHINPATNHKKLTSLNLTKESRKLIETVYWKDFELFQYPIHVSEDEQG
jgi:hypothetical protein